MKSDIARPDPDFSINFVGTLPKLNIIKKDPDDNKFIECAVASHARYIASGDSHLTKLKNYKNIKIVAVEEILIKINKGNL